MASPDLDAEIAELDALDAAAAPAPPAAAASAPAATPSLAGIASQMGGVGGLGGSVAGLTGADSVDTAIETIPLATSLLGGVAGSPAGVPGMAGGAAFGNMGGELIAAPLREMRGQPQKPIEQVGMESLFQAGGEMLGPMTTRLLNWGVKKATGPFQRDIPIDNRILKESVGVRKANDTLKMVAEDMRPRLERKYGKDIADNITSGVLMTTDLTENRVLDMAENYVGPSVFGGKKLKALREAQEDIISDIPNFIARTYGEVLEPEETAQVLVSTIRNIDEVRRGQAGSLYDYVSSHLQTALRPTTGAGGLSPGPEVPREGRLFVKSMMGRNGGDAGLVDMTPLKREDGPIERIRTALRDLNIEGLNIEDTKTTLDIVSSLPDKAPFDSVKQVKSFLGNIRRSLRAVDPKNQKIAVLTEADAGLSKAMMKSVREYDKANPGKPPLAKVFKFANEQFGDIEQRTGNAIIEGWMESVEKKGAGPEVVKKLVETPSDTRLFLSAVGKQSRAADMMRQWHIQNIWKQASGTTGGFDPAKFEGMLTNTLKSDAGVARELWGDDGLQALRRFAVGPKFIKTKDSGFGRQALAMREGGIIAAFAGTPAAMTYASSSDERPARAGDYAQAAGAGIVSYALSVKLLARLLASPSTRQAVLDARRFGAKTQRGASAVGQILAHATKDETMEIPETGTKEDIALLNEFMGRAPAAGYTQ
jgi:hypothetical protein